MTRVAVIEGDGIGPEVVGATMGILKDMDLGLEFVPAEMGLACFERTGEYLPQRTLTTLEGTKAVLFGAITSPVTPDPCYKSPLLQLRRHFDLYANIRPCFPILPEFKLVDLNTVIVRENTEGMYTGREREEGDTIILERVVSEKGCRRIVEKAIKVSRVMGFNKITCVHKANVLRKSDGLFRRVFYEVMQNTGLEANDMIVDAVAAALITKPKCFQCIVTLNLYGDILSDEAAALTGGMGMAPSANIGDRFGLFEPVHGSAPDIAGKGIANPSATILSACLMLEFLKKMDAASRLQSALVQTLTEGDRTRDLGGKLGTAKFAEKVADRLSRN
ncbi:MAG: isocitrate/isopropylmalate dehydrogenase family protein [Methanomassiliicoccales archaeon]|nr:isocitrate/isopropylmalate dehydrogenase family protein [Methanomassiliicoccales archaeon]